MMKIFSHIFFYCFAENKLREHPNMGPVNRGIVDYPRNNGVATSASNAGRAAGIGIGAGNRNNNKRQV